jgi:hypothetical protein
LDLYYLAAFLPPAVRIFTIEKEEGESVDLTCTNNNPPSLASTIRWVQDGTVLESIDLSDESAVNTVTYTTTTAGVYQCQVLSAVDAGALLLVNVTVEDTGGTGNYHAGGGVGWGGGSYGPSHGGCGRVMHVSQLDVE